MKKTYIVIASAILILFCLMYSVSYAYFSIKVNNDFNNGTSGNTTIGSDTVKDIIISDETKITSSNIIPGESVSSTFTVQNPNDVSLCFGLDWINVVNEFVNKSDIVVSLKDENGTILLEEKEFPSENNINLIEGLTIPANTTKTYTLTVTYKNTDTDQSVDMNKKFQATLTGKLTKCIYTAIETVANLAKDANKYSNEVYTVPDKTSETCTYTMAYDRTSDNNLRYVGANPCNYVTFNGETAAWRIIGILKTPEGQRLKLVREESIGELIFNYSNDWSNSILNDILNNGAYFKRTNERCSYKNSRYTKTCDFTNIGLTEEAKNKIDTITWNLGGTYSDNGYSSTSGSNHYYLKEFYSDERGRDVSGNIPTTWQGKVGLIYVSDYGFATSGSEDVNRDSCFSEKMFRLPSDCYQNNWLSHGNYWTINNNSATTGVTYYIRGSFVEFHAISSNSINVKPSIYLKGYLRFIDGEGTPENPYVIG